MSSIKNARPTGQKCGARRKNGTTCDLPAGWGTEHVGQGPCRVHGGMLPSVVSKAKGAIAEFRVTRALQEFAVPIENADPEEVLLGLVSEAAGNVAWLGHQVSELAQASPQDAGTSTWQRMTGYKKGSALFGPQIDVDKDGGEHIVGEIERGMVKLYGQWADRLAKYAKAALDAGIEKRRVEMAERHGETIVVVVNNVLVRLGISEDQLQQARTLIADEFRQLGAGGE